VLAIISTSVTEELLFRAYPIEQMTALGQRPWVGALIGLVMFVLVHIPGWHLNHVLGVVLPLGVILSLLYLWHRNLIFLVIIHLMIDLLLVFFTLTA
jgi:membrane protease YdiL (CAAX protease family)